MDKKAITAESWTIGEGRERPAKVEAKVDEVTPYLADPAVWKNYEDDDLYRADSLVRDWIAKMSENSGWRHRRLRRRYTFSQLWKLIYGYDYDHKKHAKKLRMHVHLFNYYSSRVQKSAMIEGKLVTKTVYTISPGRLKKPPYSLRLRIEWMQEHGMQVDQRTFKDPRKELIKAGRARNPRTDANMRRRREEGRKRYAERYRDRAH